MEERAMSNDQHNGPQRIPHTVSENVLSFDLQQQLEELLREEAYSSGRNSITLAKYSDFRVVLVAIKGGTTIRQHQAAGSISVQTIRGHIRMHVFGEIHDLPQGRVLMLASSVPHDVEAAEDSAFLLTTGWKEKR